MTEPTADIQAKTDDLEFDGERLVPGSAVESEIDLEHYHRYIAASELVDGCVVLDVASGAGYGSKILGARAREVIGVDISHEAVAFAQGRYSAPNVKFLQGSCTRLPVEDGSIDAVVSFETIEHIAEHDRFLDECRRVLKPSGLLIISTPDRERYNAQLAQPNPHHIKELSREEFLRLLSARFRNIEMAAQRVVFGSLVVPETGAADLDSISRSDTSEVRYAPAADRGVYHIAVCSDGPVLRFPAGVYEGSFPPNALSSLIGGINERSDLVRALTGERDQLAEQLKRSNEDRRRFADTTGTYQRRLVALETEIRIAKERLAQSQQATLEAEKQLVLSRLALQETATETAILRVRLRSADRKPSEPDTKKS